jgi:hypothetical protein
MTFKERQSTIIDSAATVVSQLEVLNADMEVRREELVDQAATIAKEVMENAAILKKNKKVITNVKKLFGL